LPTHVYDGWMDRKWIADIKERFSNREDLGREQAETLGTRS